MTETIRRAVGPSLCSHLETLEPRLLLSGTAYVVDSLADDVAADGLVTLREALEAANTNQAVFDAPAGSATETDIITFDPALTAGGAVEIATTAELVVADDVEIRGPGSDLLELSGGRAHRVMRIEVDVDVVLSGFMITRGAISREKGAGLYNAGNAVLKDVAVVDNGGTPAGSTPTPPGCCPSAPAFTTPKAPPWRSPIRSLPGTRVPTAPRSTVTAPERSRSATVRSTTTKAAAGTSRPAQ